MENKLVKATEKEEQIISDLKEKSKIVKKLE